MSHEHHTHHQGRMGPADWDRRYEDKPLYWGARPNRFVEAEAGGLPPGRALDLACGEGRNAVWLAEQGWDVTGVDFSPVAIEKAGRLAAERGVDVELVVDDVVTCPLDDGAFDLVLVAYLQLPPDEWAQVVVRAARAVAAGGTLLMVGHALRNLTEGTGGPSTAAVLWEHESIARSLVSAGLRVERAEEGLRDVDGAPRPAVDALVRARRPL
jgi:SAM-dependent methyltransferase